MSEPINIPFLVCKRKIVHQCETCGKEIILKDSPDKYTCSNCGTPFHTEFNDTGELITILQPIDNTAKFMR